MANIIDAKTAINTSGIEAGASIIKDQYTSAVRVVKDQFAQWIQAQRDLDAAIAAGGRTITGTFAPMAALRANVTATAAALKAAAAESALAHKELQALGEGATKSGFNMRYAFFGIKDVMEGRVRFAIAEAANELVRMTGPLQLVAVGVAAVAVAGYGLYELKEHFKGLSERAEAAAEPFRKLTLEIRATNDELKLSNDRLENEMAKLEGHHVNALKIELDEAAVAADKLSGSLRKDMTALDDLLEKQNIGGFKAFLTHQLSTTDVQKELRGQTGAGGFTATINEDLLEGTTAIREATTAKEKDAAQTALNAVLTGDYEQELKKLKEQLETTQRATGASGGHGPTDIKRVEELKAAIVDLSEQQESIKLKATETAEKAEKDRIDAIRENGSLDLAELERQSKMVKAVADLQIEQDHAVVERRIAGMRDSQSAAVATAAEEVRVAQAKETAITTQLQQELPKRLAAAFGVEKRKVESEAALEAFNAHAAVVKAQMALDDAEAKHARDTAIEVANINREQAHAVVEQQIAGMRDRDDAADASAAEAVRVAREKEAELRVALGAQAASSVEALRAHEVVVKAEMALDDQLAAHKRRDAQEAIDIAKQRASAERDLEEFKTKGAGESAALAIQEKKVELEQSYAAAIEHTTSQEIQHIRQIAALEKQEREDKIAAAQAQLLIAEGALITAQEAEKWAANNEQVKVALKDQEAAMKKIAELQQQINQLTQQNVTAGVQATTKALQVQEAQYRAFFNELQSGAIKAFDAMITGQKNWEKQWQELWKQSALFVVNTVLKQILTAFVENLGLMQLAQKGVDAIMQALHLANAAASKGIDTAAALAQIQAAAAVAAANAFASTAAIPFVGLELAPEAAAAAYTQVLALAPLAALEVGTNYIPSTGPYILHQGEAVTPREYNPAAGGQGARGGDTNHFSLHYHASPGASANPQTHANDMFRQVKRLAKSFNR